jgi:predicted MFS family arabinose efflux permease
MIDLVELYMWYQTYSNTIFSYLNGFTLILSISVLLDMMTITKQAKTENRPIRLWDNTHIIVASTMAIISFSGAFVLGKYIHYFVDTLTGIEFVYIVYMLLTMSARQYRVDHCQKANCVDK